LTDDRPTAPIPVSDEPEQPGSLETAPPPRRGGAGVLLGFILGVVIAVPVIILIFQNPQEVSITFLSWEIEARLLIVVAITFAAGLAIGVLFAAAFGRRRRRRRAERIAYKASRQVSTGES
jgi:uncharacterized integral membrane protein